MTTRMTFFSLLSIRRSLLLFWVSWAFPFPHWLWGNFRRGLSCAGVKKRVCNFAELRNLVLVNKMMSVLVPSGCCNKAPQKFISYSLEAGKFKIKVPADSLTNERARFLGVSSHDSVALIPFMRALPSWLNSLPKALPPNTSHWGLEFNKWIWRAGDTDTQSKAMPLSLKKLADGEHINDQW